MTLWIAWSALFSALVAVGAAAVERVAAHFGIARRAVWIVALTMASIAPILLALRPTTVVERPKSVVDAPQMLSPIDSRGVEAVATPAIGASVGTGESSWIEFADVWFARAWLVASLVYLTLLVRAMWQLHAQRARWVEGTLGASRVLIARDAGPAVVGVRRPRVVVPRWVLDADAATQDLLLRHEMEHVRAGDSRLLFAAAVLRMLFPWNAALWWMTRRLGLAIEIDCDARVVRAVGGSHAYCVMLLEVGQRFAAAMPNSAFLSEPGTNLETRILAMATPRLRRPIAASLPFVAIAIGAVAIAAQTPRPKPLVPPRVIRLDSAQTPQTARRVDVSPPVFVRALKPPPGRQYTLAVRTRGLRSDSGTTVRARVVIDPKPLRGNPGPRYPDELRASRTEGHVHLTFSTDVRGIPDTSTIRVIESTHEAFTAAVRRVLPAWRYDTSGLARMAVRFFLTGGSMGDTLPSSAIVDGVSVWPVVIVALPGEARLPETNWSVIKSYDAGMYYFRRRAYDSAIIHFKDVLKEAANTPTARDAALKLVESYKAMGYRDDAIDMCSQMRQRYPRDPGANEVCQGVATRDADAAAPPETQQGASIPNTPAGRVLKAWLEAINSGDTAQMQQFHDQYSPDSRPREARVRMEKDGPLDLIKIKTSEERTLEFVVRDRQRGGTNLAQLSLSSAEPTRITWFGFVFGRPDDSTSWEELRRLRRR